MAGLSHPQKKPRWLIARRFCMQLIFLAKEEKFDTFDKRVWSNRMEGETCLSFIQWTAQEGCQRDVLFGDSESAPRERGKFSFTQYFFKKERETKNCYLKSIELGGDRACHVVWNTQRAGLLCWTTLIGGTHPPCFALPFTHQVWASTHLQTTSHPQKLHFYI